MDEDAITFGLAALGYLLLAKDSALRIAGRRLRSLGFITAGVVLTHVALVWAWRFEWSLQEAWQKSPPAFVIFHSALLLILLAPFTASGSRDRITWVAFAIVSAGALPATIRYPELGLLAIPLLAAFLAVVAIWIARARQDVELQGKS